MVDYTVVSFEQVYLTMTFLKECHQSLLCNVLVYILSWKYFCEVCIGV